MRVFVSADMEGITGIVSREEVSRGEAEYDLPRDLLHGDVNAAVAGAFDGGASEVVVNDAHASMTNLQPDRLDERAELVRGRPKTHGMMEGFNTDFDLACFVGYHAKAGTEDAVLNHTISGRTILEVSVNGAETGELGMNARFAGAFDVPVGLVTGDDKTTAEAVAELGDVETVEVKQGIGRVAAACRSPVATRSAIREATERAVDRAAANGFEQDLAVPSPVHVEVRWKETDNAQRAGMQPYVERVDGRTTAIETDDYPTGYEHALAMIYAGFGPD